MNECLDDGVFRIGGKPLGVDPSAFGELRDATCGETASFAVASLTK